jgi:cytochrome oxidase Cu insertion factor (SCO1/SenC/PrrC family)
MSNQKSQKKKITVKHEFIMLALVFLAPIIISAWLYNNLDKWQQGGRNNGTLIEPARLLQDVQLERKQGGNFRFSELRGQWLLVHVENSDCNEICEQNLLKSRQSRLSQGGNIGRVQRVLIVKGDMSSQRLDKVLQEHREMIVVSAKDKNLTTIMEQFKLQDNIAADESHKVYLVDPQGYLMMSYDAGFPPIHLIKDLMHLLKYSRIG